MERSETSGQRVGWVCLALVATIGVAPTGCERLMTTEHRGAMTDDREWSGLHRIGDDMVVDGAELHIRCGALVRVDPGATVRVRGGGRVVSAGREGCPVTWTSTAEGDGGHWNGITVEEGGALTVRRTQVRYAGRHDAAIQVGRGGRAIFVDTTIRRATGGGISVDDGGRLERAARVEFSKVRGVPIRAPASEIGAIESPELEAESDALVVHGGLVDAPAQWDIPGHEIELVDDIRVRAPLSVEAETRIAFGIGARMIVERGGTLRVSGDEQLGYGSAHRYVRLVFQTGSGIDVRETAGEGNRFEWVLIGGPAARTSVPIRVAGDQRVEMVDVYQSEMECGGVAWTDDEKNCG